MATKKEIGLINKNKKKKDTSLPDIPQPQEPFGENSNKSVQESEPTFDFSILSQERATLRPTLEQKAEFDALLQVSTFEYSYELFSELLYAGVQELTKEERRKYEDYLRDFKIKALEKERKKQAKKNR
ncbi:replication-associated protein [Enterococcus faecalis]|uniref:replication-associated protein n=1 Tax=Enterococcus faecalis TaxID=1351 RepID=UPI0018833BC0|nr:replication-associated protein [Enterococcus faecalis]MBF0018502.1 replication-associated protein [Enterococcus faecalis]